MCVAAGGHADMLCYLLSVSVRELTLPEGFGSIITRQIAWMYRCHLGTTVAWERRK